MLTKNTSYRIGAVAKQSEIPVKTIRYYEELGLLKTVGRTAGGFRLFGADVFFRLEFIKCAQTSGMSLAEVREVLEVFEDHASPCDRLKAKLQRKLDKIEAQIQQLHILKYQLKDIASSQPVFLNKSVGNNQPYSR